MSETTKTITDDGYMLLIWPQPCSKGEWAWSITFPNGSGRGGFTQTQEQAHRDVQKALEQARKR